MTIKTSQSGFSIVESLIAMALLGMVALLLTYVSSNRLAQLSNKEHATCIQHSNITLEKIKALGTKSLGSMNTTQNLINRPSNRPEDAVGYITRSEEILTADPQLFDELPNRSLRLQNHKAIIGTMSMLNAMYDANPAYCRNARGAEYEVSGAGVMESLLESGDFVHLKNARATLKIEPYNLNTGALLDPRCPQPLIAIPPGHLAGDPYSVTQNIVTLPPGARNSVGYIGTVYTSYEDASGGIKHCNASMQYRYPNVSMNPQALNGVQVDVIRGDTLPEPVSYSACTTTFPLVTVVIDSQIEDYAATKGSILLCRSSAAFEPAGGETCVGSPPITGGFPTVDLDPSNVYRPCHELTLCGVAPSTTVQSNRGYTLTFRNVSLGCRATVQARLVDLGNNITENLGALDNLVPAARAGCENICSGGYTDTPGTVGFCSGGSRTPANSCSPGSTVDPPPGGDEGGDGYSDGGDTDGKGDDGGSH